MLTFLLITYVLMVLTGVTVIIIGLYLIKKHLSELRENLAFIKSLSKDKFFFGYHDSDGIFAKTAFINQVSCVVTKKNYPKLKERFNPRILKLIQIYSYLCAIGAIFLVVSFVGQYFYSK